MKNNLVKIFIPCILFLAIVFAANTYAIYGVDYGKGYFDGHKMCTDSGDGDTDGDGTQDCMKGDMDDSKFYVLPSDSLSGGIDSADKLYELLKNYNDSDSDRKKAGSGLIVNTMMGRDSDGEGKDISDETWKDLKARLRSMDAKDQIKWTGSYTYCSISSFYTKYYYNSSGDEKDNKDIAFYEMDGCETDSAIRFYDDDGGDPIYVLSRVCGNPVGDDLGELPEANEWEVSVKSEIINKSSLPLTVGSTVSWKHTVKNEGPDETDVDVKYRYEDGGVLGSGSGSDHEFSKGADDNDDESFNSTSRAITQDDVGGQMCRATSAKPKSWESDDRKTSGYDCVTIPYNYSLLPAVTTSIVGGTVEADVRISVYPTNTNEIIANPTKSKNTQWRVTEIIFDKDTDVPAALLNNSTYSDSEPCPSGIYFNPNAGCRNITNVADKTGNTVFTENGGWRSGDVLTTNVVIGGHEVGTKVCYAFSIQPNKSAIGSGDDNRWRHSKLNCLTVGKKPKVQIHGSDLSARGIVQTSTSDKIIAGQQRRFGSWVEYGIFASGTISGTASGSAFNWPGLISQNTCDYSRLSFSNTANESPCNNASPVIGNYSNMSDMPNVEASFTGGTIINNDSVITTNNLIADSSLDSGPKIYNGIGSGNITLNASELISGKSVVIKTSGTVTINGNLAYSNDDNGAKYTSIYKLPQLVIIAQNINIADNVTNIDGWLIAKDSINTCSSVGGATLPTNAALTSNMCNQKLTVNGPIMANSLWLRRTAGSDAGANSAEPAEVFNLRADAYLWSMARASGAGQIQTVYTVELPPRL